MNEEIGRFKNIDTDNSMKPITESEMWDRILKAWDEYWEGQ